METVPKVKQVEVAGSSCLGLEVGTEDEQIHRYKGQM